MIVQCNFEELQALAAGAELVAHAYDLDAQQAAVAAPVEAVASVEALVPQLTGDLKVSTLAEQRRLQDAVSLICDILHESMEGRFLDAHPADEHAVLFYFSYAHSRTVLERIEEIGKEMEAMIEVMTGEPVSDEAARRITFPK